MELYNDTNGEIYSGDKFYHEVTDMMKTVAVARRAKEAWEII